MVKRALGLFIGAAFVVSAGAAQAASDVTLKIGNYGGIFDQVQKKYVVDLLTARTGIKVEFVDANPSDHLAKLMASRGREAPYDLVYLDDNVQAEGIKAGLFEKVGETDVPNLKYVYDVAKDKDGYGPAVNFYSVGITYNIEKFKEAGIDAPTSWADLWNPKLAGHVGVPTLDNTMGHAFLVAAEHLNGGSEATPEKGVAKIATLKAQSYPGSSSTVTTLLSSGNAWIVPWMNGRSWAMIDRGAPLAFVIPKDGGYVGMTKLDIVKGTTHRKEAEIYMNQVLDPLSQLGMVEEVSYGSVNKLLAGIMAAYPEMSKKFPASPEDLAKLHQIDWDNFNKTLAKAVTEWNRQVASK